MFLKDELTLYPGVFYFTCQQVRSQCSLCIVSQVVKRLPKTRSGKIMRRILRKVAMGATSDLGDMSTLEDLSVVKEIIEAHEQYRKQQGEEEKKK